MIYCKKCVLSDNLFSVKINEDGVCNYCVAYEKQIKKTEIKEEENKELEESKNTGNYDVLLAYSGGKDSTYALYLLKEKLKLNVLTMTFDNGYLTEQTYKNIKAVSAKLNVDNIIVSPSIVKMNNVFRFAINDTSLPKKSLERASSICTYCISFVKAAAYKEAIMRKIPLIAFGWTPGQVQTKNQKIKLNYKMVKSNFVRMKEKVVSQFGNEYETLFLSDEILEEHKDEMPALYYPFWDEEYDEDIINTTIKGLGWDKPKGIDMNSTNCLLNSYAINNHMKTYGFHPYALELSQLIRTGSLTREEAMKRILVIEDNDTIKYVEKKLFNL